MPWHMTGGAQDPADPVPGEGDESGKRPLDQDSPE